MSMHKSTEGRCGAALFAAHHIKTDVIVRAEVGPLHQLATAVMLSAALASLLIVCPTQKTGTTRIRCAGL